MRDMKKLLWSFLLCAGFAVPAAADFESGLAAYYKLDYAAAMQEWLPLAEQGDAKAAYQLGVLYYRGEGVLPNARTAAKWFEIGAQLGDPDAQYNLAVMYANGEGIAQSLEKSHMWFLLADWRYQTGDASEWALRNRELAARNRDLTAAQMTKAGIARAQGQAADMQSKLIALDQQIALQAAPAPAAKQPDAATPAPAVAAQPVAVIPAPEAPDVAATPAPETQDVAVAPADSELPESMPGTTPEDGLFPIVSDFLSLKGPTGNRRTGPHLGIDIRAPHGTPVLAVADGVVYRSRLHKENGHEIKIKHAPGTADEVRIQYGNLNQRLVKVGDKVTRGQVIGIVGDSGSESRTKVAFLHFALWVSSGGDCCNNVNPHDHWYDTDEALPIYRPDGDYSNEPHRFVYPLPAQSDLDFFKSITTALNLE